jgi:uncharacterized protein involved in response to NO
MVSKMLAFRPFFAGAIVMAILVMIAWMGVYLLHLPVDESGISTFQWHAHEMIFGYSMAVIAGFLLTAARNWTGLETLAGARLAWLFASWLLARLLMLAGTQLIVWAALADMLFMLGLGFAVTRPIVSVRQKRQAPVVLIVGLLTAANALFYLGATGLLSGGANWGIYGGLYLVLGMVLFMGSRVIPFFTEGGVGYTVEMKNARWNDVTMFILYPLFLLTEVFNPNHAAGAVLAAGLALSNSIRVTGWYTPGIWKKPLLWGLFAAFSMIILGFGLRALALVNTMPTFIPVHAFAVGGVGMMTIAMMARVTLGHTGRNIHQAPAIVTPMLVSMLLAAIVRVFLPLIAPSHYTLWVSVSAILWIVSFVLFASAYLPMLLKPRVDGKPG